MSGDTSLPIVAEQSTNDNLTNSQTPMMAQYWEVKNKHKDSLLFFRMGDFYELFFDDAVIASQELDIALTKRGKSDGQDIAMCGVPFHAYEGYLAKLIQKGHKVAICEQLESPSEAKKRGYKSIVKRDVVRIVTPGTLTEETLLSANSHNFLTCVYKTKSSKDSYVLSSVDLSTGEFFIDQVEPQNLTAMLAWIQPAELIMQDRLFDLQHQNGELQFVKDKQWRNKITFLPDARFDHKNAHQRMLDLYNVATLSGFGDISQDQICAAGTLIDYIYLTQKKSLTFLKHPTIINQSNYLLIDPATRKSLELDRTLSGSREGSLLHAIDRTQTAAGARLFKFRFLGPLTNVNEINNRLDDVEFFVKQNCVSEQTRSILKSTPDMERAISRLCMGRGGARDLGAIRDGLKSAWNMKNIFSSFAEPNLTHNLKSALAKLGDFQDLQHSLEQALADQLPTFLRDGGFISPGFNKELDELRYIRDHSKDIIRDLQNEYIQKTGINTLKIKHNNILGYHIDITPQHAPKMDQEFIHRQTLASSMRYTTPQLAQVEQRINQSVDQALAIELEIFQNFVAQIQECAQELLDLSQSLAIFDVSNSLAMLAIENNYTRPLIDKSKSFYVEKGRHGVVEQVLKKENKPFMANDCNLDEHKSFILLTGPNMAGKSTYLRQNALLVVMAQMGSFVPAEKMQLGVVDRLFSRVGASDDLAAGQSTFMVEMVETAAILNQATDRSLVILDEIGRGTATYDGMAIAWAVAESLCDVNQCRSLFATHYHELSQLQDTKPTIKCMTMKIQEWQGKIIFMHQVIDGTADKSYGVHVAQLAGLPKAVIDRANYILQQFDDESFIKIQVKATKSVKSKPSVSIAPQLPLQDPNIINTPANQEPSAVEKALNAINIDDLTPRQALEKLYELKKTISKAN